MSKMEVEARPLLDEDNENFDRLLYAHRSRRSSHLRLWAYTIITHGAVALLVILMFQIWPRSLIIPHIENCSATIHPTLYSPLNPVIKYTIDHPARDAWANSLYFGPPSDDSERAWNTIIHPHGLQVFPDEAKHFDELNTVKLENGNPLFILGLYHNLHCLRRIRQTIQADHYYPNMTKGQRQHDLEHTMHCLEAIRTSMMCHPDLTPNRFFWSDRAWHDLSVAPDVTRKCVNWDLVQAFMKDREYDPISIVKENGKSLDRIYDDLLDGSDTAVHSED